MSEVFHVGYSRILVIGLALSLFCSGCQSSPPLTKSPVECPVPPTPREQEQDIPDIPVKPIAEIAKDLGRAAGFVLAGAYVLNLKPNRKVDGRWTRGTIGYLSVGQIVFLDECATQITTYQPSMDPLASRAPPGETQTYCRVTTSSGIEGLVRVDRVVRLEDRVAIAIGDAEISVLAESPDPTPSQSIGRFSRSYGTYVEILDESTKYFRVRMPWSKPKGYGRPPDANAEGFLILRCCRRNSASCGASVVPVRRRERDRPHRGDLRIFH